MAEVLAILSKAPAPGRVKTRMAPPLTPVEAAAVYEASLRDVIERARGSDRGVQIFFDPAPGAREYFRRAFPDLVLVRQEGEDLGARIRNAFGTLFAEAADRAVIIGADSPTLPRSRLTEGLSALDAADVTLGPTRDGGYYLVGIRRPAWPQAAAIFENVPWSTPSVLRMTLQLAEKASLAVVCLDPWYDLDSATDLLEAIPDIEPESHLGRLVSGHTPLAEEIRRLRMATTGRQS